MQTSQGRCRHFSLFCLNVIFLGAELLSAEEVNGQPCENALQVVRCDLIVGVSQ